MKFKQQWHRELMQLPLSLRSHCIDYKGWKKVVKQNSPSPPPEDQLQRELQRDLHRVEKVFTRHHNVYNCFSKTAPRVEDHMLYRFAVLNCICVRKIVKRCDKRIGSSLKAWYNANKLTYTFCGGVKLKHLELTLFGCKDPCPVCLDTPETIIIFDCGHIVCLECLKDLYKIRDKRGTLQNLVRFASHVNSPTPRCPMCRMFDPLKVIKVQNIFHPYKTHKQLQTILNGVSS